MRQKIELLAPCGGWEPLKAVIEAGADAVYFSEKRFAMRQHGDWLNFTRDELGQAVAYARERGVKSYITVNNLLTREELALLDEHLVYLDAIRPDAIIIQDLGLLRRIRALGIATDIHASTMMNVHHSHGADFLKRHGIKRIITSRDISIYQAAEMARDTGLEVEYFLHGDMCVAQGSQCYHSGIASEMSANRGKCLKSCRWQWSLIDRDTDKILGHVEEQYVLARKDMCLYHQIPELIAAGIASLKIEGRARPADYLRPIVALYREAIDRYYDDPSAYSTDFDALAKLRSKTLREIGTSHAFYTPNVGSSGLSGKREPRIFSIAVEERPYEAPQSHRVPRESGPIAGPIPELSVRCMTEAAAFALLDAPCDWIYVGGEHFSSTEGKAWNAGRLDAFIAAAHARGKKVGINTPRITSNREFAELDALIDRLADNPPDEYLVHNAGALAYLEQRSNVPLHGDYSLNIWNREAAALLAQNGMDLFTPGLELTLAQIADLSGTIAAPMECMIHGSLPGMLLEYCAVGTHMTGTGRHDPCPGPCSKRNYALRDKLDQPHWLETDQYCRNHLFMVKDLCTVGFLGDVVETGAARLRIEGPLYRPDYLATLVSVYRKALERLWSGDRDVHRADLESIRAGAPRHLTSGAYGNPTVAVSNPCTELPTEVVIRYRPEPARLS